MQFRRADYVLLVPFVEDVQTVFLKAIIPSRESRAGAAVVRPIRRL
jgi:hypothetical protein